MKKHTIMLPSISNLLMISHDPPPTLNLSPASPILLPSTPPYYSDNSPRYQYSIPSPHCLPPLQGDDPPQRLRLPSPSPQPSSPVMIHNWTSPPLLPSISATLPAQQRNYRHRTLSEQDGVYYPPPRFTQSASPSPPSSHHRLRVPHQRQRSVSASHEIPSTQIVFDASGQPVLKRRRGRPPTLRDADSCDGGWTFLAPTVWDVHVSEEQKEREIKADQRMSNAPIPLPQHTHNELLMNDAMNAFTNSNMDTILHMPRKKRGRKPKTHITGNSCFVWKDLTSARSSNHHTNSPTTDAQKQ